MNDMTKKTALAHTLKKTTGPMSAVERAHSDAPHRFVSTEDTVERDENFHSTVATCTSQIGLQPAKATFDDIQYFSSLADFQIQNLISLFETYQVGDIFGSEQRIEKLSGMCRTVQRAVEDIKKSVRTARNDEQPDTDLVGTNRQDALARCGTLKALTDF